MNGHWMVSTALIAIVAVPAQVHAQTAATDPQAEKPVTAEPTPPAPQEGLQDIIVTAQRRSENLQNAAIAVSAISANGLVDAGVTDAAQLTSVVPVLQIGSVTGPYNSFYLRGVGNFTTNALSDSAIAFSVDGVYFARSSAASGVFYDLDRVEVLKGPQGTLYGRNATGGAINVITAKPVIGEYSGNASFEYGNYDAKKFNAALNAPFGSTGAIRVATQIVDRDGYLSDGTSDEKSQAVRVQMANEFSDAVKLTVGGDYYHQGGIGAGATLTGLPFKDQIGLADPRAQAIYQSSLAFSAGNVLVPITRNQFSDNTFYGFYAQADIRTPIGTLTVLPGYRHADLSFRNAAGGFDSVQKEQDEQASVEVRLASRGSAPLTYLIGGYYLHETTGLLANYNQNYFAAYVAPETTTDSYAAFGRLTYALTDRLRLTGGIRYTSDHKRATLSEVDLIAICPGAFVPPPGGPQFCFGGPSLPVQLTAPAYAFAPNGSVIPVQPFGTAGNILIGAGVNSTPNRTFNKTTYRGAIEFDVGPRSLLYASVETGFKSGGFYASIDGGAYDPETITAYTIGSKNRFLDNRLQFNIEAFYWQYRNQQFSHFRNNSLGGTEFITENIGKSTIKGAEVETRALVTPTTLLSATAQYLDARNDNYVYRNPASVGAPTTGCASRLDAAAGVYVIDCSGLRPPQAPKWTLSFGGEQTVPLGDAGKVVLNARTRYQSDTLTAPDFLAAQIQKAYWITDLQATFTPASDRFSVTGFVNNVADKIVIANSQLNGQSPGLVAYALRPPRTYGIRVGVKF